MEQHEQHAEIAVLLLRHYPRLTLLCPRQCVHLETRVIFLQHVQLTKKVLKNLSCAKALYSTERQSYLHILDWHRAPLCALLMLSQIFRSPHDYVYVAHEWKRCKCAVMFNSVSLSQWLGEQVKFQFVNNNLFFHTSRGTQLHEFFLTVPRTCTETFQYMLICKCASASISGYRG